MRLKIYWEQRYFMTKESMDGLKPMIILIVKPMMISIVKPMMVLIYKIQDIRSIFFQKMKMIIARFWRVTCRLI